MALSVWPTAPWRRAPLLLATGTPGVFVAAVGAAAVLSTAAASGTLFLASTATAALHNEAALACPQAAQPAITDDRGPAEYPSAIQAPARLVGADRSVRGAMRNAGLPTPELVATSNVTVGARDEAFLYYRPDARAHVNVIARRNGTGVWIPASYARVHGEHVGSTVALGRARVAVTGVYRDLAPSAFVPLFRLPRYWCAWTQDVVPTPFSRPPPMFLPDRASLLRAGATVTATWYDPTPITRRTVPSAASALEAATRAAARLPQTQYHVRADLGLLVAKAERSRDGLRGPVVPIAIAGTLVAALLVAASGTYWGVRRARELRLLRSRGVGRAALGGKAALENLPAIALGTLGGWGAAIWLVRTVGPSALLEPGAPGRALQVAALVGAGAVAATATTGARTVAADRRHRRRPVLARLPWEVALLAAGLVAYLHVRHGGVRIVKATVQLDPMVFAFPLLALTGAVLLLGRMQWLALRGRSMPGRMPTAGYLAWRRVLGTPAVAVGVVVGVALPMSVLVYSAALAGSTRADLQAKFETNVGAEYAFGTLAARGSTPDLDHAGTAVSMIQTDPHIDTGTEVRVMGVDPDTFADFAFQGRQLRSELALLRPAGRRLAALLVNAPDDTRVRRLTIRTRTIPIDVVGTRASFPGLRDPYEPLLVVDRAQLPALDPGTDRIEEMWTTRAAVSSALAALRRAGVDANYQITPSTFLDNTGLRPVSWIFGYLRALALLAGAVAVTGLSFAFTARIRRSALAYHLALRMGLRRALHRRSLALEVGALLAAAWVAGVGLALGAVGLVYPITDAYPEFPPPPSWPDANGVVLGSAAAIVAAILTATLLLQWSIDRASVNRLLRA